MSAPLDRLHEAAALASAIVNLCKLEDAESAVTAIRELAVSAHDKIDAALRELDPGEPGIGFACPLRRELDDRARGTQ